MTNTHRTKMIRKLFRLARFHRGSFVIALLLGCLGAYLLASRRTPEKTFQKALLSAESGDLSELSTALRTLGQDPQYQSESDLLLGVRLLKFGRAVSALQCFSRVSPSGKLREPLLFYSALAFEKSSRKPEAVAMLRTLVSENPDHAEAHRWLGIIYYDLGAYDLAILHMRKVAQLIPGDFRPCRMMGIMYSDFAQHKEAIESYREGLARNPPEQVAMEMAEELSASLISLKEFDQAMELLLPIRASAIAETLKARCYLNAGLNAEAEAALKKAKQLAPDDRSVCLLEADIRVAQGERTAAVEVLRRSTQLFPYDAEFRYQLGLALRDAGELEEAKVEMAAWSRLKELSAQLSEKNFRALSRPQDAEIRNELAELCEQLGKPDLAAMWRGAATALKSAKSTQNDQAENVGQQ